MIFSYSIIYKEEGQTFLIILFWVKKYSEDSWRFFAVVYVNI